MERVRLFDIYEGESIAADRVSLAFAIEYRSRQRTLTDNEVADAFDGVVASLQETLDVEIR